MKRRNGVKAPVARKPKGEGVRARSHPVVRVFAGKTPREARGESLLEAEDMPEAPPPSPPRRPRSVAIAPPLSPRDEKRRLDAITRSPSYLRAYEDLDFLKLAELRPVRLQLELLKPEMILQKEGVRSTVVVFGGTRIAPRPEAKAKVDALEARARTRPRDPEIARQLAVARRILDKSKYYDEARKFARLVSLGGQHGGKADYVIVTGGGPGVMEAANRGAWEVGAKSVGMNITLPHEQYPNPYITPELCFQFHYFAIRKMHLLLRAKALVAFPGGFGTLDELFETLTLVQTLKVEPLPVLLFGRDFWNGVVNFQYLVDEGVIDPQDAGLFSMVETAEEAWQKICDFYEHGPKGR
jgi:uncharacterized protein (TIGR00730 family)